jgi:uncharacterized protein
MAVSIECPTCARKTVFAPSNPWRPFCSERCRSTDLGAWASDSYVIGGNSQESAGGGDPEDDPRQDG